MLLTIDIGNTNISIGIFHKNKLIKKWKIPTSLPAVNSIKEIAATNKISAVAICSVVPKLTAKLSSTLGKSLKAKILIAGRNIKVPIKNLYKKPKQVGQDRLINAYAGLKLYGKGLIIIDFGTAITFDIVSKKGEYLGGLIFPGVNLCLNSLYKNTALLPKVSLKSAKKIIGRNTVESINSGVFHGIAGMCEALIKRLKSQFKGYKIIVTGGNAQTMKMFSRKLGKYQPNLTLLGLKYISK